MAIEETITSALRELKEKFDEYLSENQNLDSLLSETHKGRDVEKIKSELFRVVKYPTKGIIKPKYIKNIYKLRKQLKKSCDNAEYKTIAEDFSARRKHDLETIQSYIDSVRTILPTDKSRAPKDLIISNIKLIDICIAATRNWYDYDMARDLESIKSYFTLYLKNSRKKRVVTPPSQDIPVKKKGKARWLLIPVGVLAIVAGVSYSKFPVKEREFPSQYINHNPARYRSKPAQKTKKEVIIFIQSNNMYDCNMNPEGYQYNEYINNGDDTITDLTTSLQWDIHGVPYYIPYKNAKSYINFLNKKQFAGHADWRIPTIEELLTINEKNPSLYQTKIEKKLHIDSWFSNEITTALWSCDWYGKNKNWGLEIIKGGVGLADNTKDMAGVIGVRTVR